MADAALLRVDGLKTQFHTRAGIARAVDGVSLTLAPGETLCVVGESGCGKSITALSIMGLVPSPPGRITEGSIELEGFGDLVKLSDEEMRRVRGAAISMIFQEPMTSLNPVFTVGEQIAEIIREHQALSRAEAASRAVDMLRLVGVPEPALRARSYPHQLSGGMRQRVMIAIALACRPKVLIADEPTTALDVTIQAQILDLMNRLKQEVGTAIILITHNMGVVAEMAQRVAVMYAGVVVEEAAVGRLFADPKHPYTIGLLGSIPRPDRHRDEAAPGRLSTVPGTVPDLYRMPPGCRFADRCPSVFDRCRTDEPVLAPPPGEDGRTVRCWLHAS